MVALPSLVSFLLLDKLKDNTLIVMSQMEWPEGDVFMHKLKSKKIDDFIYLLRIFAQHGSSQRQLDHF